MGHAHSGSRERQAPSAASVEEAVALRERARIARELHDGVAQTLYAITLVAARARETGDMGEASPLARAVEQILRLANDGQAEVRGLMGQLWANEPESASLTQALLSLAAAFEASQGIEVRLTVGPEPTVTPTTCEALARIAQEALHNVAKHAAARHIDLLLQTRETEMVLSIADDGRGFDPDRPRPGHFGLRSMRERAASIRATFEVTSAPGRGTRVRVRLPLT